MDNVTITSLDTESGIATVDITVGDATYTQQILVPVGSDLETKNAVKIYAANYKADILASTDTPAEMDSPSVVGVSIEI